MSPFPFCCQGSLLTACAWSLMLEIPRQVAISSAVIIIGAAPSDSAVTPSRESLPSESSGRSGFGVFSITADLWSPPRLQGVDGFKRNATSLMLNRSPAKICRPTTGGWWSGMCKRSTPSRGTYKTRNRPRKRRPSRRQNGNQKLLLPPPGRRWSSLALGTDGDRAADTPATLLLSSASPAGPRHLGRRQTLDIRRQNADINMKIIGQLPHHRSAQRLLLR